MALPPSLNVRLLAIAALLVASAAPSETQAQPQSFPKVEIRQDNGMGPGSPAWGAAARVKLDRDAFLVVVELGVDGRARVVFPESPREKAFVRATRNFLVPLPSADVMFVNTSYNRRPTVVAFASDMAPDLSEFTRYGHQWDYQFAMEYDQATDDVIRDLATLIYGDPEMPYSVAQTRVAPVLSAFAQRALIDCGYTLGGLTSADFMDFLWDVYGPYQFYGVGGWGSRMSGSNVYWGYMGSSYYMPFGTTSFGRFTSRSLWNRYGAGCNGWGFQRPFIVALHQAPLSEEPQPVDSLGLPEKPKDRTGDKPNDKVDGVGIIPATPEEMKRREVKVTTLVAANAVANTKLSREAANDLLQRRDVAAALQMLAMQRVTGLTEEEILAQSRRAQSSNGGIYRRSPSSRGDSRGSGFGPSIGGSSSSVGGGGSSEVGGSGGAGASGEARGGSAGGGRGGSGRVPPGQ
jgi:hypothetical protein